MPASVLQKNLEASFSALPSVQAMWLFRSCLNKRAWLSSLYGTSDLPLHYEHVRQAEDCERDEAYRCVCFIYLLNYSCAQHFIEAKLI